MVYRAVFKCTLVFGGKQVFSSVYRYSCCIQVSEVNVGVLKCIQVCTIMYGIHRCFQVYTGVYGVMGIHGVSKCFRVCTDV